MTSGLKRSTMGLLLLPLLGAAVACSSPDPSPEAAPNPAPSASPRSPSPSSPAKPAPSSSTSSSASAAPTSVPAVPAPESSAAQPEGVVQVPQPAPVPTFDAPETDFLADKVPEGTDPNAVLQVGQEHCDRLLSAKELDADSVISELIMNRTQGVTDAVTSLCPELLPELEAADRGFPDGVFAVGAAAPSGDAPSVAPGTYRVYGMPPGCTISVYSGAELVGTFEDLAPVTIGADATRVESDQCYSWLRS